jgi:undecaprenyl pyrophosphate phosphatase UppP
VRHLLIMTAFAFVAAVVFGTVAKDTNQERLAYGAKVFAEFLIIGLVLAWVLYMIPF